MRFTVVWKPQAKNRLSEIWIDASDRPAVSMGANTIDSLLKSTPLEHGESRSGNQRIVIVPPLAVIYEVHIEDRRVDVLSVRLLPGCSRPD